MTRTIMELVEPRIFHTMMRRRTAMITPAIFMMLFSSRLGILSIDKKDG